MEFKVVQPGRIFGFVRTTVLLLAVCFAGQARSAHNYESLDCYQTVAASRFEDAVRFCTLAANIGDSEAQFKLAMLYAQGQGVEKNIARSIQWLQAASDLGHSEAQYNLAYAYQYGKGVEVDYDSAIRLYKQSGRKGYAKSQRNLAFIYESGTGVPVDPGMAYLWFLRSAEQGMATSQLKVGIGLLEGKGVKADREAAQSWIEKSAESGYDEAQFALGTLVMETDPDRAIELYRKAIFKGNVYAMFNLAKHLHTRDASESELNEAYQLADRAIKAGHQDSVVLQHSIEQSLQSLKLETKFVKLKQTTGPKPVPAKNLVSTNRTDVSVVSEPKQIIKREAVVEVPPAEIEVSEEWLFGLKPHHYTIQMVLSSSIDGVKEFIQIHGLQNSAHYHATMRDNRLVYIVTSGTYANHASATRALSALPEGVREIGVFVQRIENLQTQFISPK